MKHPFSFRYALWLLILVLLPLPIRAQRGIDAQEGEVASALRNAPKPLAVWALAGQDSMTRLLGAQLPRLSEGSTAVLVIAGVRNQHMMHPWYTAIRQNHLRRGGPVYVLWAERASISRTRALLHTGIALRTRRLANRQAYRRFTPPGGAYHLLMVLHNGRLTHVVPLDKSHLTTLLPLLLEAAQNPRKQAVLEPYRTQRIQP